MDDEPPILLSGPGSWRQWLRRNHGRDRGVWVLLAKKGTTGGVSYQRGAGGGEGERALETAYASASPPRMTAVVRDALAGAQLTDAWSRLAPSLRLRLLYWIADAKRPQTRARRLADLPAPVREKRTPGFAAR